jgi:hypothetical protein
MKTIKTAIIATIVLSANLATAANKVECTKNRNKEALTALPQETAARPYLALLDGPKARESVPQVTPKSAR